uniref:Uncharacterized protein n=1 Tax=Ornithodoros turicata TaxID=34597 RepID=A0A2R5LG57_9ACAR
MDDRRGTMSVKITNGQVDGMVNLAGDIPPSKVPRVDLVALAEQIQTADSFVQASVSNKLSVIVEQVRFLQKQAQAILEEGKRNADLHHAACNFKKVPGSTYYLYRRQAGQKYFSMIKPEEWGTSCPHEFLGGYRLEYDMSWTPLKDLERFDQDRNCVRHIAQLVQGELEPMAIADSLSSFKQHN